MSTRVSRRAVFASVAASALAKPAQETPASADEELKATVSAQRAAFEQIRKVELPVFVEPAAVFKP